MKIHMDFENLEGDNKPKQKPVDISQLVRELHAFKRRFDIADIEGEAICNEIRGLKPSYITNNRVQGFIDQIPNIITEIRINDLGSETSPSSVEELICTYVSILLEHSRTKSFILDTTELPFALDRIGPGLDDVKLKVIGALGNMGAGAENCVFEADRIVVTSERAKDCVFKARYIDVIGNEATRCKYYMDDFGEIGGLYFYSSGEDFYDCEFHSKKPFPDDVLEKSGSSRFFVNGVEVKYE